MPPRPWWPALAHAQTESAAPAAPAAAAKGHPFACTDYSQGKVFLVSAEGKVEWEYPAPSCNDLWVLPNGNLLFNTGHGVKEVTRDKKVVFAYESKSEIYACQRLANGNTFIGECNAGRLLEVDPAGKIVKEIRLLPEGKDGGHAYMRNARRLANGNYLVAHYGEQVVREYDPPGQGRAGDPGRRRPAQRDPPAQRQHADRLRRHGQGGRGCSRSTRRARPSGRSTGDELPGISLKFMAGLQRLPNGNTVMSNWLGHGQFGKAPHLIEVTPDKKVVWTFADHETMKTISSVQLLDVPGDVTKGEIAH